MSTAVITPIYNEDNETVYQCLDNIKYQSINCDHYIYIDGWKNFNEDLTSKYPKLKIFTGNIFFADSGDTPRSILATIILRSNYKNVYMLDVDNYYLEKSIEMINEFAIKNNSEIVFSKRAITNENGFWENHSESKSFVDMNCISFHGIGLRYLKLLNYIPRELCEIDDRILSQMIANITTNFKYYNKVSVIYKNKWGNAKRKLRKKIILSKMKSFMSEENILSKITKLETGLTFKND